MSSIKAYSEMIAAKITIDGSNHTNLINALDIVKNQCRYTKLKVDSIKDLIRANSSRLIAKISSFSVNKIVSEIAETLK